MSRPTLQHLQLNGLIAAAGGDPWAVDDSLQAGSPTQINFLAQAFHQAGHSTGEAEQTFQAAQQHFQHYQQENGEHPINDGAEVARVKSDLHASNEQLAQIAGDLETIAAALAEARTTTAGDITTLNTNLQSYDAQIAGYLAQEQAGHNCDAQIKQLSDQAVADTATTLHNVTGTRTAYSTALQQSLTNLRVKDGYDPNLDPDHAVNRYDAAGSPDGGAGATGGNGTLPPWLLPPAASGAPPPGAPKAPQTQPSQVGGKWGNVGDGIAGAAGAANAPWLRPDLPGFVPGGSPSAAIPGGIPLSPALETAERFGKGLGVAGVGASALNGYFEYSNAVDNGVAASTAAVDVIPKTVGDVAGGWVGAGMGAETGGEIGATIGTFFGPGPGTAIGAALGAGTGAVIGGLAGSKFGSEVGEGISSVSHDIWHSLFG